MLAELTAIQRQDNVRANAISQADQESLEAEFNRIRDAVLDLSIPSQKKCRL